MDAKQTQNLTPHTCCVSSSSRGNVYFTWQWLFVSLSSAVPIFAPSLLHLSLVCMFLPVLLLSAQLLSHFLPFSLHRLVSIKPRFLSVPLLVCFHSHSRHRQNSVGMNTPKATRMGNIKLLLSAA